MLKCPALRFLQGWMHRLAIGRSKWIKKALNYYYCYTLWSLSLQTLTVWIHSANEIFQARVANIISDIEESSNSQNDIIIWGKTREELHEQTVQLLEATRKNGMKLNPAECVFSRTELIFLCHNVTASGVKPDTSKISTIIDMPIPSNAKELQRFMGIVNYLGKIFFQVSRKFLNLC